jgi:hypothetical protein
VTTADSTQNFNPPLTVYIDRSGIRSGMGTICLAAQGIATGMFAKAGVRINWQVGNPNASLPGRLIVINMTTSPSETFHPGALASAYVYEGVHITVFFDRVENTYPSAVSKLLGHVMVHEIVHVLEGFDHHSEEGVMKAQWTADDLVKMAQKPLPFTLGDLSLIREGLARRQSDIKTTASINGDDLVVRVGTPKIGYGGRHQDWPTK